MKTCKDAFFWQKKGYLVVKVDFDVDSWEKYLFPDVKKLFGGYIAAEILTKRVARSFKLYSDDKI